MYPTLSDLIKDIFGVYIPLPIQSFGLMLAISFLCAAYTLTLEFKRKERSGLLKPTIVENEKEKSSTTTDLIISCIIGFVVGYKSLYIILNYTEFVNDTQGTILSSKGNFFGGIIGAAIAFYLNYKDVKKDIHINGYPETTTVYPHQLIGNITMLAAVSGLLGAKIFNSLENLDDFFSDPIESLVSFSGLTMYGGLICAGCALLWYGKKHGIPPLIMCDSNAPGLMLAYGTGRIGCQLAGDGDWGIVNISPKPNWMSFLPDWLWSYNYPHNVNSVGVPIPDCVGKHCMMLPQGVFPTPFYETIVCLIFFVVLWSIRKKITTPGILFFIYLIMNGFERFFIEKIRVNTKYHIFGHAITQAEIISTLLFFGGIIGLYMVMKNKDKTSTG